ncbi:MAG TPA: putative Ig domain-containing protein [Longimicrobium sp.]|nr:putative Ig domain-containing protein [Longimicrobium sp.]
MMSNRKKTAARAAAALLGLGALVLGAFSAIPARVDDETRTGWFHVVWQTRGTENALADVLYLLVDARGRSTRLTLSDADRADALRLNGRAVSVTGELTPAAADGPALRVRTLRAEQGPRFSVAGAPQSGSKAYVTIICRFSDQATSDPFPRSVYEGWMGNAYPGLDHYWRELSEHRVDLTGTRVVGPYVLPKTSAQYMTTSSQADLGALVADCTKAADAEVDFSAFAGINMQFNSNLGGFSWGGGWTLTLDGVTRRWATTWMANWATLATYAHELGHSLGLPHSSGPYNQVYDSRWDVMSGGGSTDVVAGTRVAPHTIAFHKDMLGWVPAARKYVAPPGTRATITLERGGNPGAQGYLMAQVPILGTNHFYTIEARRYTGYDAAGRLPAEAVVVHKVNLGDSSPARVVDADANGNPNDEGAQWVPGETFVDAAAQFRLTVLEQTATGFRVEVSTQGGVAVQGDSLRPAATMGAAYSDKLSAAGLPDAGQWKVAAGRLPTGLAISFDGTISGIPAEAGSFTFTVTVVSGAVFGARTFTLDVAKPQLAEGAVMSQLLGGGAALTDDQVRFLDILGNRNGRLDVGDVRAWLQDRNVLPSQVTAEAR